MRLPFFMLILMAAAGLCPNATGGEMFNFLGQNATEDDAKQWATAALNDPTQLGFNSVGMPGQKNFDDRTFSFIVSNITGSITLYAFSDDGVTVNITNTTDPMNNVSWKALDKYGVGQALPDLTQSFKKCTGTLESGNSYIVTISYLNTLYTGGGDIDGVAMIGVGGNAVANQPPYFIDPSPSRLKVGQQGIIDIRQLFPSSPGNSAEAASQDTTLTYVLDPTGANATLSLEVLDSNNTWVAQQQPYKFNKGEYTAQGRIARIKVTPNAAGDFKVVVTATDSLGAKTDSTTKINAIGDNALVAARDKYNFLPPSSLVIPKAQGVLQNDYMTPSPMAGQVTITVTVDAKHGDVDILNDGSFTYSPKDGDQFWSQQNGLGPDRENDLLQDVFTYQVQYLGMTASATVTIQAARASSCSDPSTMPNVNPTPGAMLVGGGGVPPEAIDWLRDHGKGGNLVVLSGSGGAFAGVYASESAAGAWKCVTSLVINSTATANDPTVKATIDGATAIFIEGGDQTIYWTSWSNTPVQTALGAKVRNIPIGGSSAGMHLLGGVIYTPPLTGDGISSSEALANPNSPLMGFQGPFVNMPNLATVVTDTHFRERDRMARSLAFVTQSSANKSLMADESTALLVDGAIGKVVGTGAVYFVMPPDTAIQSPNPLTVGESNVLRLLNGAGQFDLAAWNFAPQGTNGVSYPVSVTNGVITPIFPYGPNY